MHDAEKLIATIKAVRIPQGYDLKAWELDAIHTDAKLDTFRMIGHAFEYGFLKGQRAAKAKKAAPVELKPMVKQVQQIHSMVLACALDDIDQNGCEPGQFVSALHALENELDALEAALAGTRSNAD